MLLGRACEQEAIDRLVASARSGVGGALVVRGEPGIGKTALLAYAVDSADGMQTIYTAGIESEIELGFSGIHRLVGSLLDGLEVLPAAQRHALSSAFGLGDERVPDRFFVGMAVLTLLSGAAGPRRLLGVVDDAQWLDHKSLENLAFVARRLSADGVALIVAAGEPAEMHISLDDLPQLHLEGLPVAAARDLLARTVGGHLDAHVRDLIIAETRRNPFALLELARELTPAQLAGRSALPDRLPLSHRLEETILRRVRRLSPESQSLLLLVAADSSGDSDLVVRAAASLGIAGEAFDLVEEEGLLRRGTRIELSHPLRAAVYDAAPEDRRRLAHDALAGAIDIEVDPDQRVWHRAAAARAPDADVAAELERAAERALSRPDYTAAAALLERAAQLTRDPANRVTLALGAARAAVAAGLTAKASVLLAGLSLEVTTPLHRAEAARLRGVIDFALGRGASGYKRLIEAAGAFARYDARLARDTHLEALLASIYSGRLGASVTTFDAAQAARAAPPVEPSEVTVADFLLEGFTSLLSGDNLAAVPPLRQAIRLLLLDDDPRWLPLGCMAAIVLWDESAILALAEHWVELARRSGALTMLPSVLRFRAVWCEALVGRFEAAEADLQESGEIAAACGDAAAVHRVEICRLFVAAWRGHEAEVRARAQKDIQESRTRGQAAEVGFGNQAIAVLELGLGRSKEALKAARAANDYHPVIAATFTLPDIVEAAVRSGEREAAAIAVQQIADSALASGSEWALGVLARSRALIAEDGDAEDYYEDAIEHLAHSRVTPQLARARLVYGEWLRRNRRRREAREQLRLAYEMFVAMGANGFAERAAIELLATGERARRRVVETVDFLTPQEHRVARLVIEGESNPEIAVRLFISPRTVEYHLHKVFRKLGVSSRTQITPELLER